MASQYLSSSIGRPAQEAASTERLAFIDGFRAFAIIAIVFGHCFTLSFGSASGEPSSWDFLLNLIAGNTALFVFISGLLFHHIFYSRWDYGKFLTGKLRNVFIPFAIVSAFLFLGAKTNSQFAYAHTHHVLGAVDSVYVQYAFSLVSGQLGLSLWYVPFIGIIFIASPIFVKFIDLDPKQRAAVLVAALILGLFVNRAPYNADKFQNVAYFVFYYLLGIEVSLRRAAIAAWLAKRETLLTLSIMLAAILYLESVWQGFYGSYANWFEPGEPNVRYVQKIVLIFLCCAVFTQIPALNRGLMKKLADDSFGVFFVHNLVIGFFITVLGAGVWVTSFKMLDLMIYGTLVLFLSWVSVIAIKRAAGHRSRLIIGA